MTHKNRERIDKLDETADENRFFAELIEENLDLVDACIDGVNILLDAGMDWNDVCCHFIFIFIFIFIFLVLFLFLFL